MSHYRVLIVIKNQDIKQVTEDDFYEILHKNCIDDYYGEPIEPFGFDSLVKYTEIFKGIDVDKYSFSEIIIGDTELWWDKGSCSKYPKISKEDVLKMIDNDDYCMLFDGHL